MNSDDAPASRSSRREGNWWAGLPPKRRRFYLWVFLFWFLLGPLGAIPLQIFGASEIGAGVIVFGLSVAVLVPMGWAAWQEFQQRRASGEEPAPARVKGRVVGAWAVATIVFWGVTVLVAASRGPLIPLMPIVLSVITAVRLRTWLRQRAEPAI